jgi:hypothetical protein
MSVTAVISSLFGGSQIANGSANSRIAKPEEPGFIVKPGF